MIALIIGYFVANYAKLPEGTYTSKEAFYDLHKETVVLYRKDLPWIEKPCALRFAIYVKSAPRTIAKVDCITIVPSTDNTQFKPSCNDSTFPKCICSGTDCTRCGIDNTASSFMFKLLENGDFLQLWASGFTSNNDKYNIPAVLKVKTAVTPTSYAMEGIVLPAIPLQKWTVVTIVKEGRRFDVFYGAVLVKSQLLDHVPVPTTNTDWKTGNPLWKGQIGLFKGFQGTHTAQDVEADVTNLVDTTGKPKALDAFKFDLTALEMPCLLGDCNKIPQTIAPNPYLIWNSSSV